MLLVVIPICEVNIWIWAFFFPTLEEVLQNEKTYSWSWEQAPPPSSLPLEIQYRSSTDWGLGHRSHGRGVAWTKSLHLHPQITWNYPSVGRHEAESNGFLSSVHSFSSPQHPDTSKYGHGGHERDSKFKKIKFRQMQQRQPWTTWGGSESFPKRSLQTTLQPRRCHFRGAILGVIARTGRRTREGFLGLIPCSGLGPGAWAPYQAVCPAELGSP